MSDLQACSSFSVPPAGYAGGVERFVCLDANSNPISVTFCAVGGDCMESFMGLPPLTQAQAASLGGGVAVCFVIAWAVRQVVGMLGGR
ncbi:hypothetical protein V8921_08175 [Ralstonia mannitolilytica]|uniref:hypothetical protein n=1 Tax=Ralstonia mannitolilytica TaxID=105219 RepID=UPI001315A6E4|nr:hypothetical protein [Ralstonia mannitolilytica]